MNTLSLGVSLVTFGLIGLFVYIDRAHARAVLPAREAARRERTGTPSAR
ncbi:hypothetical protein [Phreatobacter sp. AB_2022a]|nr:hypothetical protein [Phreatobacter sp. AB_2022a]MCZ0735552.1 hypothetical protein [Phreatobacter sp. AB_2022a]